MNLDREIEERIGERATVLENKEDKNGKKIK